MQSKNKSGFAPAPDPEIRQPVPAEQEEIRKEQESLEQIPAVGPMTPEVPLPPPDFAPPEKDGEQ